MAINEAVAPYPSCLCQDFLRGRVQRETISLDNDDNKNNNNNNNNNNNLSRDSADLLGMYIIKLF